MEPTIYTVLISDFKTIESAGILQTVLGSCIAICLYESERKVASLSHALLPSIEFSSKQGGKNPKKYVDTLIQMQLAELRSLGVLKKNLVAKLIGGANMFSEVVPDSENHVGKKNAKKAQEILNELQIPVVGQDLGNYFGRKVNFNVETGIVTVLKPSGEHWKTL